MEKNHHYLRNIYRSVFFVSLVGLTLAACGGEVLVHNPKGNPAPGSNPPGGSTPDPGTPPPDPGTPPEPGAGVTCSLAEKGDPCGTPGDWCTTYDVTSDEFCEAWCENDGTWFKECYSDDWQDDDYCYQPPDLCPAQFPVMGSACGTTSECQYYDCEYTNLCGGDGWGIAFCEYGTWWVDSYCGGSGAGGNSGGG